MKTATGKQSNKTNVAAANNKKPKQGLKRKDYDKRLTRLHVELVKLQEWVVHKGLKVCIVFEGRDGAGKGGTIKAITERAEPARVSGRGPACTHRTRKEPDVHPALPATSCRLPVKS